jgi:hypothetical protein
MNRPSRLTSAILFAVIALSASDAMAARVLLAELLTRQPAAAGQHAMSALALEACLRRAGKLDRTGVALDTQVVGIDRLAAEGMMLQNQLDAELPIVGNYDEKGLNDFQRRVIRREELTRQFKSDFPVYQNSQKNYDAAMAEFDRDCSGPFTAGDLDAAKTKLGLK